MADVQSLIDAFQRGESKAFSKIYMHYFPKLKQYGAIFAQDFTIVENCIQDFFVYMLKNQGQLQHVMNFDGYVYKSIRHRILTEVEKQNRRAIILKLAKNSDQLEASIEQLTTEQEGHDYRVQWMRQQIAHLPTRQREIIYLRFYEGFTYEKIAKITMLSNQVARNYVSRSLKKIRQRRELGEP